MRIPLKCKLCVNPKINIKLKLCNKDECNENYKISVQNIKQGVNK